MVHVHISKKEVRKLADTPAYRNILEGVKLAIAQNRKKINGKWPDTKSKYITGRNREAFMRLCCDGAEYDFLLADMRNAKSRTSIFYSPLGDQPDAKIRVDYNLPVKKRESMLAAALIEAEVRRKLDGFQLYSLKDIARTLSDLLLERNSKKTSGETKKQEADVPSYEILGLERYLNSGSGKPDDVPDWAMAEFDKCRFWVSGLNLTDDLTDLIEHREHLKRQRIDYLIVRLVPNGSNLPKYGLLVQKSINGAVDIADRWKGQSVHALLGRVNSGRQYKEFTFVE